MSGLQYFDNMLGNTESRRMEQHKSNHQKLTLFWYQVQAIVAKNSEYATESGRPLSVIADDAEIGREVRQLLEES